MEYRIKKKWSIDSGETIPFWDQNWLVDGNAIDKPADFPEELNSFTIADFWNAQIEGVEY